MTKPSLLTLALVGAAVVSSTAFSSDAEACGGCFVQNESTQVTDHRMALSIGKQQTVLWDQIRYTGDPREFAWVLPVRAGTTIEVGNDAFFTALDAATQPVIVPPNRTGGNVGCGITGCAASASDSSGAPGEGQVQILSQAVVGPYETVTLRATDPDALNRWLKSHAFTIPASIEPVISAYVREGFDFIALRLAPKCGERQMRPVRVVTPGADPTLPLRMVAAGVGSRVGITLYVIGEGRYRPQNFPEAKIDFENDLTWSRSTNRSNYQALSEAAMAENGGRAWLTEFSGKVDVAYPSSGRFRTSFHPALSDAYYGQCRVGGSSTGSGTGSTGSTQSPCYDSPAPDASTPASDAGLDGARDASQDAATTDAGEPVDVDAGEDASVLEDGGTNEDAGKDASTEPFPRPEDDAGQASPPVGKGPLAACAYLDDLAVATEGMRADQVWVTRLRAVLPADALGAGDLRLEASASQVELSSVHYVTAFDGEVSSSRPAGCANGGAKKTTFGSWAFASVLGVIGLAWVRRRRRR